MEEYKLPKYYQLKKIIIGKIDNDEYAISETIPSERELMAEYDMSRITVRKAIEDLVQEGYLYKVHGKGTYVKGDTNGYNLLSITSCTEDIKRMGMTPSRKVLVSEVITADKKRQRILNLGKDEKIFCLSRIYYADEEEVNYTTTYLPYRFFEGIEQYDFSELSLYEQIEKEYGVRITRAERTIEAIIAHDEIAEYLKVDSSIPIILFQCVTYGMINGKEYPIETLKCYYRSDKFKFCIHQVR
ncbi:MAG: GntR family transcriptional regulator [Lachnospiraceae bacterium]